MPDRASSGDEGRWRGVPALSSITLIQRARAGDSEALEQLCKRYLPRLTNWAQGRLPRWARDLLDTEDLVQETIVKTLAHLESFEPRRDGALQAYLRQAVSNRIRDEIRRARRHPAPMELDFEHPSSAASPLEETIGRETLERYERALSRLKPLDREAVIARIELGIGYEEIAEALDKPSANAARMAVCRALLRLARELDSDGAGR